MRLLAIGDIHGCLRALETLFTFIRPNADDQFITLGDYVDRGPDSKGVLDCLIALHASGHLVPLRGNHDWMMTVASDPESNPRAWLSCGGDATLDSYGGYFDQVPESHWRFLNETCVDWYETDRHIFVHAGVDPNKPMTEQTTEQLHWEKLSPRWCQGHMSGKVVVCGHTAQPNGRPLNLGHTICVDTYIYGGGWLTALDVLSGRYWQANELGMTREGRLNED